MDRYPLWIDVLWIDVPMDRCPMDTRPLTGAFGRRVSFLAKGVIRDSEEAHLLKTVPSGGAWRSEDEGEEALLTRL